MMGALGANSKGAPEVLRIQYGLTFRTLGPNIIRQLNRLSNFTYLLRSFASCKPTHLTPKGKLNTKK